MERNKQELSSKTKKVKIKNRLKNFVKVLLHNSNKLKTLIQDGLTVLISVLIIYAIAQAGSLTPSAEPDSTMHSLSDIAGSGFATATHSLKALYDKINSLVADIWNKQTSELTTSGTIGKLLVDNLDTAISTRSSHSAADVWSVENRTLTAEVTPRGPVVAMSARSASTYTHADAAKYCYNLSAAAEVAMDGDTTTVYTDWRLPTVEEAAVFEGTITDSYVWTATIYETTSSNWIILSLSDGNWNNFACSGYGYVRCVR